MNKMKPQLGLGLLWQSLTLRHHSLHRPLGEPYLCSIAFLLTLGSSFPRFPCPVCSKPHSCAVPWLSADAQQWVGVRHSPWSP